MTRHTIPYPLTKQIMMMDDEDGEMHLRNLKLYEAATEEVS